MPKITIPANADPEQFMLMPNGEYRCEKCAFMVTSLLCPAASLLGGPPVGCAIYDAKNNNPR